MNGVFDDLNEVAEECLSPIVQDPANRGRSWDQCYTFFQKYRDSAREQRRANRELACLHLGFYLASWGMFRGSGLLMQKDYTIYGAIIDLLLRPAYQELRRPRFLEGLLLGQDTISDNEQIGSVFGLAEQIRAYVKELPIIRNPRSCRESAKCTPTIVTKILLGTLACTPAYDINLPKGLTACGIRRCGSFTRDCFTNLLNVCREKRLWQALERHPVERHGVIYPIMRVVDLYFWKKGFDESEKKRRRGNK